MVTEKNAFDLFISLNVECVFEETKNLRKTFLQQPITLSFLILAMHLEHFHCSKG